MNPDLINIKIFHDEINNINYKRNSYILNGVLLFLLLISLTLVIIIVIKKYNLYKNKKKN